MFSFVRKISDKRVRVRMTSQVGGGGYTLHYKNSYERNFVTRIFVKRRLAVLPVVVGPIRTLEGSTEVDIKEIWRAHINWIHLTQYGLQL
jgi:hypothetical protein